jgi:Rad3-related DNA helicase
MDPVVKRRMAKESNKYYDLETLKTLIQQVGRSTRGVDDYSTTIIGDKGLGRLIHKWKDELPKGFLKSITWSK